MSMLSVYLAPETPRWSPATEQDLRTAIDHGLLEESHYLDLKRELEPGKARNREHARDMASFAVDGGTLLVGIAETAGGLKLAPQPLAGLRERVEAIARTIPDPPLSVVIRAIPSASDPSVGYLVIHVPPSPLAPHMVDNRYLGRGASAKYYLSDAEVISLHTRRRDAEVDAVELIRSEIDRDPVPSDRRCQAHLFMLAEPLAGRPEVLMHLVSASGWNVRLGQFLERSCYTGETARVLGEYEHRFSPDIRSCSTAARRTRGAAMTTHRLATDRTLRDDASPNGEDVVEVELHEDGGVRFFMSRLSDAVNRGGTHAEQEIFDTAMVVFGRRLAALTLAIANDAGYFGPWALAAAATGLRGLRAFRPGGWGHQSDHRFTEDDWTGATIASYQELATSPGTVTDRFVGQFLRALGAAQLGTRH